MKRFILFTLITLISFASSTYSQEPDTSKVRIGNKKYTIIIDDDKEIRIITDDMNIDNNIIVHHKKKKRPRKMNGTWDGLEFGLANFMNYDYTLDLPQNGGFMEPDMMKSWTVNLNFAEKSLGIIYNYFGIVTGLGLEYSRYMLNNDVKLSEVDGFMTGIPVDMKLDKNKFSMTYLTLPLMLEFQIPVYREHNRIKVSAGVVGGMRIGSRQVQKYQINDEKQKLKNKDSFNLRNFRYGFTGRVGYGDVSLFANYYPQTLFVDGMGPEIYPVTVGLHFGGE